MAVSTKFYPRLTDLLPKSAVPEEFSSLQDGLENILKNVYYRNLQSQKSFHGDAAFFSLSLIAYNRLAIEFPGTGGLALVLNPSIVDQTFTEFPVSLEVQLEILKYVNSFNLKEFAQDPSSFYNLFLDLASVTEGELLMGLIETFYDSELRLEQFVIDFNLNRGTSIAVDGTLDSEAERADDLVNQINVSHTFLQVIFEDFVLTDSFGETIENLVKLFGSFFGQFDIEDAKRLLLPKISARINDITIALEFPRTLFLPLDEFDEVIEDEDVKTLLTFDIGSLSFATKEGFIFQGEGNFSFQRSLIGRSGFILEMYDMRLDLSRDSNIPEATADGRPDDFIGAYITYAALGFPAFWNHDDSNSTGQITARNLLVGTGGISGTLGLEAKTAGNPSPLIKAKFGSGFEISLDAFDITFQQNAIIGSNIHGTMRIPGFEDAAGNPAEISIDVHIGQDGDFSVTAREADGIELGVKDVFKIILKSASIGRQDDRFFLSVSGSLSFDQGESIMADLIPKAIEFQEIIIWDDGQFEIKGGGLELPQALTLSYPPVEMSITAIHLGSSEREYEHIGTKHLRKYKYFGFDGAVKVDPGGGSPLKSFFASMGFRNFGKYKPKGNIFGQTKSYRCASASLRMVMDDIGEEFTEEYLAQLLRTTESTGASILDIPTVLTNDLKLSGIEVIKGGTRIPSEGLVKLSDFLSAFKKGDTAIVSVGFINRPKHAIIIDKIEGNRVFIRDPLPEGLGSSYSLHIKQFELAFNKKFVIFKKQ